jgi:hypothetical protein
MAKAKATLPRAALARTKSVVALAEGISEQSSPARLRPTAHGCRQRDKQGEDQPLAGRLHPKERRAFERADEEKDPRQDVENHQQRKDLFAFEPSCERKPEAARVVLKRLDESVVGELRLAPQPG